MAVVAAAARMAEAGKAMGGEAAAWEMVMVVAEMAAAEKAVEDPRG